MSAPGSPLNGPVAFVAWLAAAVGRWVAGVFAGFIFALPFSPSIWAIWRFGGYCFTSPSVAEDALACLGEKVLFAPMILMIGPIAHDEEEPPSPWPGVLLTALILAIIAQLLMMWWHRRALRKST